MTSQRQNKKRTRRTPGDPAVAEVRRARAALLKEAGGTLQGLFELVRREGAARQAKGPKRGRAA
jgi:hypothetical protein